MNQPRHSVSLSLVRLRVMLCVVAVLCACRCGLGVCVRCGCGTLKTPRVYIQNVPVCAGTYPHVVTLANVVPVHTGVLNVHTGRGGGGVSRDTPTPTSTHCTPHYTPSTHTHNAQRTNAKHTTQNKQNGIVSSAHQNLPTWGYHLTQRLSPKKPLDLTRFSN